MALGRNELKSSKRVIGMAEKKGVVKKVRKEGSGITGPMMGALNGWFGYIRRKAVHYYVGLLKIGLAALFASWIVLVAILLVGFALLFGAGVALGIAGMTDDTTVNMAATTITIIGCLIGFVILTWVERTIQMTALIFTEAEFNGRRFSLIESVLRIYWPVFRLTLADIGLSILFMVPAALIVVFAMANTLTAAGSIGLILVVLYVAFFIIVYAYLAQFWSYGVVLERRGVWDSLKQSVHIATRNIVEVLLFDIVWVLGILAFAIPLIIYSFISGVASSVLQAMIENGGLAMLGAYLLFVIVNAIISTVLATILEAFGTPTHYLFWKNVKGA